jgi:hypothetical protein
VINILAKDLFLNALGFCLLVVIIIIPWINPPAKNEEDTKPPGQMMVCATWVGHHDVDLWARPADQDKATGYSNKNGGTMDLLLDDLGTKDIPHIECQFASALPDGLWAVNLHGYSVTEKSVSVHVEVRMGGEYGLKLLMATDLDIRSKQERTVAQFRLVGGKVVAGSLNEVYVPLRSAGK